MSSTKHRARSGEGGKSKAALILAIVLLQALILLFVVATVYLSGEFRSEGSAEPDSSWTAWP